MLSRTQRAIRAKLVTAAADGYRQSVAHNPDASRIAQHGLYHQWRSLALERRPLPSWRETGFRVIEASNDGVVLTAGAQEHHQ